MIATKQSRACGAATVDTRRIFCSQKHEGASALIVFTLRRPLREAFVVCDHLESIVVFPPDRLCRSRPRAIPLRARQKAAFNTPLASTRPVYLAILTSDCRSEDVSNA